MEHLEQLASPNLDSDSKESVFDRVETLYNTVVSVRWDNVITLWLNDRCRYWSRFSEHQMTGSLIFKIFLKFKESKEPTQFKLSNAD